LVVEEQEIAALQRLGLTEYEAKIYLVLINTGPRKASELSFRGDVPRTKTYGAIKELERKGLLRIIPGKPEACVAGSPNEVLMPMVEKLNRELSITQEVIQRLALAYEAARYTKPNVPKESQEFWEIVGRQAIINKLNQIISEASESVNFCTSAAGLVRAYKAHSDVFSKARRRGAVIRFLSPVTRETSSVAEEMSEVVDFKLIDKPFGENFTTVDGRELVVVESHPEDLRTDRGEDRCIWTTNRLLVELHEQLFDRVWNGLPQTKLHAR
jgi:sugar-specific transcriptional regulator TrmB